MKKQLLALAVAGALVSSAVQAAVTKVSADNFASAVDNIISSECNEPKSNSCGFNVAQLACPYIVGQWPNAKVQCNPTLDVELGQYRAIITTGGDITARIPGKKLFDFVESIKGFLDKQLNYDTCKLIDQYFFILIDNSLKHLCPELF